MSNSRERASSVRAILAMGEGPLRMRAVVEILTREIEQLEHDTAELRNAIVMCRQAMHQSGQSGDGLAGRLNCH